MKKWQLRTKGNIERLHPEISKSPPQLELMNKLPAKSLLNGRNQSNSKDETHIRHE